MRAARRVDFPIPPICDRADQCVAPVWRYKGIARCHRVVFDALLWQTPWRRLGVHSAGSLDGGHYPPCSRPTSQHGDACTQGGGASLQGTSRQDRFISRDKDRPRGCHRGRSRNVWLEAELCRQTSAVEAELCRRQSCAAILQTLENEERQRPCA